MRVAIIVLIATLFLAPLAYFDELQVWGFEEPVSNLEWDEAGIRPQQSGGDSSDSDSGGSGGTSDSGTGDSGGSSNSDPGGGSGSGSDQCQNTACGSGPSGQSGGQGGSGSEGSEGSGGSEGDPQGSGNWTGSSCEPSSGSWGSGGSGSGGCGSGGGHGIAFGWPGMFSAFFLSFGVMFAFWGKAMVAFFTAMWQFAAALVWWYWMLAMLIFLPIFLLFWYLLSWLGIVGGVIGAGALFGLVYMHSQGMLFPPRPT